MPKKLEMLLMKEAMSKGLKGDNKNAYVYGTMNKIKKKEAKKKR